MPSVITTSKSSPCQRSNASSPSSVEVTRCPRLSNCMVRVSRLNGWSSRKQDRERPCLFPLLDLDNSGTRFAGLAGRRLGQRKIELDREAGAVAQFAAQADLAAHQVYQASADVQPQAAAGRLAKQQESRPARMAGTAWPGPPPKYRGRCRLPRAANEASPASRRPTARTVTPPRSVNLMALPSRLNNTCLKCRDPPAPSARDPRRVPVPGKDSSAASAHQPTAGFL